MQTVNQADQHNPTHAPCRTLRAGGFMPKLSPAALEDINSIRPATSYEPGEVLFAEKQESAGVFILREGLVRISMNSSGGKRLSLRVARAGEILGLSSALFTTRCEATAETLSSARITYLTGPEFHSFLRRHPEAYQLVTEEICLQYFRACDQLRTVGLASTAPEKLARLLLDMSENGQPTGNGTSFRFMLTHEQIGEFIGATRETVTRTLGAFKLRRLVNFNGSIVTIPNLRALEHCAHS